MVDDLSQWHAGDEAQVQGTRHRQVRLGLNFMTAHVHVDFLITEREGHPALAELF
ncbi:hypothetical protein D3C85_1765530 [compost metagenome]